MSAPRRADFAALDELLRRRVIENEPRHGAASTLVTELRQVVVEEVRHTGGRRRLDLAALEAAARRCGHSDVWAALRQLTERPLREIFAGVVPGSITRRRIAAAFGADEHEIWPAAPAGAGQP